MTTTTEKLARQKAIGEATIAAMKAYDEGFGLKPVLRTQSSTVNKSDFITILTTDKSERLRTMRTLGIGKETLDNLIVRELNGEGRGNLEKLLETLAEDSVPDAPNILLSKAQVDSAEAIRRSNARHQERQAILSNNTAHENPAPAILTAKPGVKGVDYAIPAKRNRG